MICTITNRLIVSQRFTHWLICLLVVLTASGCGLFKKAGLIMPEVDNSLVQSLAEIKSYNESWASALKDHQEKTGKEDGYLKGMELYIEAKAKSDKVVDGVIHQIRNKSDADLNTFYGSISEAQLASSQFIEHAKTTIQCQNTGEQCYGIVIPWEALVSPIVGFLTNRELPIEERILGFESNARIRLFGDVQF